MEAPKPHESRLSKASVRSSIVALVAMFGAVRAGGMEEPQADKMMMEGNVKGDRMWADEEGRTQALTDASPLVAVEALNLDEALEYTPKNRSAVQALLAEEN